MDGIVCSAGSQKVRRCWNQRNGKEHSATEIEETEGRRRHDGDDSGRWIYRRSETQMESRRKREVNLADAPALWYDSQSKQVPSSSEGRRCIPTYLQCRIFYRKRVMLLPLPVCSSGLSQKWISCGTPMHSLSWEKKASGRELLSARIRRSWQTRYTELLAYLSGDYWKCDYRNPRSGIFTTPPWWITSKWSEYLLLTLVLSSSCFRTSSEC